eukprot:TRINITY_DN21152_c0_g1_i1.p1 TRINITY_DN21152_c0_g1~~TRINITY_DN21152_c0_g1_i1.p1  ORF type:complete len:780 (+),score=185.26 TRINITY_DN21152_c0_g1_i1:99-2438(+)
MVHYEVVSSAELGGALVREGRSLTSKQISRLGIGSIVSEEESVGERLRFKKVSGPGPETGWVSSKLLARVDQGKKATSAPAPYSGRSLMVQAEAKVIKEGAYSVLLQYSSKGQDGEALVYTAVAHLADGRPADAATRASEALPLLAGKDGVASAKLVVGLAKMAGGDAQEALGHVTEALSIFREVGDKQMEASSLATVANVRLMLKDISVADVAIKEALKIFREIGDADGEQAAQLTFYDICVAKEGREKALKSVAQEKASYCKNKGDKKGEGEALQKLAQQQLANSSTAIEEALKLSQQALSLFREAGDRRLEASALHTVAAAELLGPESLARSQALEEAIQVSKEIGDEASQVDLLYTLSSSRLVSGQTSEALKAADEATALGKKLGDKLGEARGAHAAAAAQLAQGSTTEALQLAKDAAAIFSSQADRLGEAGALQTAATARCAQGGPESCEETTELAKTAAGLFRNAGDELGEAHVLLQLADMLLSFEGSLQAGFQAKIEAGHAAERARQLFLLKGDKRSQGRASHTSAQSKILLGDIDGGIDAAMQAVVLARNTGDRWVEASALRTAMAGQVSKGELAEALRMAREVQFLFKKLGSNNVAEAVGALMRQLDEAMPKSGLMQRLTVQPKNTNLNLTGASIFSEVTNCIVWSIPVTQQTYILYCLELLKFVDDLKNVPGKIAFLVLTRGVMGRHTGEPVACQYEGITAATVWAVCRSVRLEAPKLLISTVDVPSSATTHEVTDCIRAARYDAGGRGEVSFIVDRTNQLGHRPASAR